MEIKAKNISSFVVNVTSGSIPPGKIGVVTEAELSTLWAFFEKVEEPKQVKQKEK